MSTSLSLQRGIVGSVLENKGYAFASNEKGEEVLLLDSRRRLWEEGAFRLCTFAEQAEFPLKGTPVTMEVETRPDGKLRATRWAPLYVIEGQLKFFSPEKKWGFVVTPMGEVFIHLDKLKRYERDQFLPLSGTKECPTHPGTIIVLRMPKKLRAEDKSPSAIEWAVK